MPSLKLFRLNSNFLFNCLYSSFLYLNVSICSFISFPFSYAQTDEVKVRPLFAPIRDVTVEYAVQISNSPLLQKRKIYFSKTGKILRIDGPQNIGATLVDTEKQTATIIANKPKVYAVIPSKSKQNGLFIDSSMYFEKKKTDRVLGIPCQIWKAKGRAGSEEICVTRDGVLLRQEGVDVDGIEGKTVALSVDYSPLPHSVFEIPLGYQQVKLPQRKGDNPKLIAPDSQGQPLSLIKASQGKEGINVDRSHNPYITPQRDVDVVYAIAGAMPGLPPFHQRMRWSASSWQQRINSQGLDTYMITDYKQKKLIVVNPVLKVKTTSPAPGENVSEPGLRPSGDYIKVGEATVATFPCDEWRIKDSEGNMNNICYTKDGVMLRVVRNNIPLILALKVNYKTQDAHIFEIPTNLRELAPARP